jgi:hypothetical protein
LGDFEGEEALGFGEEKRRNRTKLLLRKPKPEANNLITEKWPLNHSSSPHYAILSFLEAPMRGRLIVMVARETVTPIPVTGRRFRRRDRFTRKSVFRALCVGTVVLGVVLARTVPIALSAKEGYRQISIKRQLIDINRENEALQEEVARLKSPDRVDAYAQKNGMVKRQGAQFIALKPEKAAPPAPKPFFMRLASISFR